MKIGSQLRAGRIELTYAQKQRDRANALMAIFKKGENVPKGFKRNRITPDVQEEDLATRHERKMRRLFS